MTKESQTQIEGMATLLVLGDELRKVSNLREFGFFATNETHRFIPYHTAFLWQRTQLSISLLAQSGTPEIDTSAIFIHSLKDKFEAILKSSNASEIHQIDNFKENNAASSSALWEQSLPPYILWCPFLSKTRQITGGLVLFREKIFSPDEIKMLRWLIENYQYAWSHLNKKNVLPSWERIKQKPYLIIGGIVLLGILLMPIKLSVLATGIVVPKDPAYINAPIEGTIKSFAVTPGSYVKENQLLFIMDKSELQANADVIEKEYSLTQSKLRTAINEAYDKKEAKAEIPILRAQLAIDKAKIDYIFNKLQKTEVRSPINGIVVFDSKEDWIGQPVTTGEKILLVADPSQTELKIMLPVPNAIELEVGAEGVFFLHGQFKAIPLRIKTLGYNAKLTPNKTLAYKLSAAFVDVQTAPPLGSQGTVRLYGNRVPFFYYLFRRPLQTLRQFFGI